MTNTFYKAFTSEQYKLSKNREIFGVLLLPVLVILAIDGYVIYDILKSGSSEGGTNPWRDVLGKSVFMFYYLLYPILVAIFVYACCDVEYKNNNYKILFTIPVSKGKIFFSKAVFILLTILLSVILSYFTFLLSGYFLGVLFPKLGFQNFDYREVIFMTFLKLYLTLAAVSMIQLAISLTFRSFIYPLGFSMFMLVFSGIVQQKAFSDFIPYTGGIKSYLNILSDSKTFERLDYSNIAMIFVFLFFSFYLFSRKRKI